VDVETYARTHFNKSVKKTLTIPQWLNDMATAKKINLSKVLQAALKAELGVEA
jgi:post-segregation antitoxin (ccd killing protein)